MITLLRFIINSDHIMKMGVIMMTDYFNHHRKPMPLCFSPEAVWGIIETYNEKIKDAVSDTTCESKVVETPAIDDD